MLGAQQSHSPVCNGKKTRKSERERPREQKNRVRRGEIEEKAGPGQGVQKVPARSAGGRVF